MQTALIIFVKNAVYGKVKTRIAATLGDAKALDIYRALVAHTHRITVLLPHDKYVYYSDYVEPDDVWNNPFFKRQQEGTDLGIRMKHAVEQVFNEGHEQVIIIGSDCMELDAGIIEQAFAALNKTDAVIGPATDGGYCLLGLTAMHNRLFENIAWSTNRVLDQTLAVCRELQLHYILLPQLSDIDEAADWIKIAER